MTEDDDLGAEVDDDVDSDDNERDGNGEHDEDSDASLLATIKQGMGNPFGDGDDGSGGATDYYKEDPKKWLRAFFDREGGHLNFGMEQDGPGHERVYTCTIQLPIQTNGEPLVAQASIQGKKKEAVEMAALEACNMLHARGLLKQHEAAAVKQQARKESVAKKQSGAGDSDDDTFFDRTGQIEAKKKRREKRKQMQSVETFETLSAKKGAVLAQLLGTKKKISAASAAARASADTAESADPLDAFMTTMSSANSKHDTKKLRAKQRELMSELAELDQLLSMAAPALAPIQPTVFTTSPSAEAKGGQASGRVDGQGEGPGQAVNAAEAMPAAATASAAETVRGSAALTATSSPGLRQDSTAHTQTTTQATAAKTKAKAAAAAVEVTKPTQKRKADNSSSGDGSSGGSSGGVGAGEVAPPAKRKRVYSVAMRPPDNTNTSESAPVAAGKQKTHGHDTEEEAAAVWVPPSNQSGDGKTSLNAKYGY